MTTTVYVLPDDMVPASQEWQYDDVTSASFSAITGFRRVSQTQRRRLLATLTYAHDGKTLGRIEALRDMLRGGANFVQVKWRPETLRDRGAAQTVAWSNDDPAAVAWSNGSAAAVTWSNSRSSRAVYAVDGRKITVRGFAAGQHVALAGELIRIAARDVFVRVIDTAHADASGNAVIRVQDASTVFVGDLLEFGAAMDVIAHPVSPISAARRANALHDPVTIELRQVFADEIGVYVTDAPWS